MIKKLVTLITVTALFFVPYGAFGAGKGETISEYEPVDGLLGVDRRREQFPKDFSYFIYPISASVPGIGTAYGGGATVTNIKGTDTDFTGFYLQGDFDAIGVAVLNYHVIDERLLFDAAHYRAKVAPQQFARGIDSDPDDYILPEVEADITVAQLTLTFFERMIEFYARYGFGSQKLLNVLDSEENRFENIDTGAKSFSGANIGFAFDITDDKQDPRKGVRFEAKQNINFTNPENSSKFDVYDYNLTGYLPVGEASVWGFNAFFSEARMRSSATTDKDELKEKIGLQCHTIGDPAEKAECEATETRFLDERIAANRYGRATAVGGTQRLRSFPNGRYYAGNSVFFGTEYRWNITEERTLMDWYILKGFRTNFQLAFFAGTGSVADEKGELFDTMRSSYGVGFRVLFSGITIRIDWATGDEGDEVQLFFDYPWSMFSVDNPL